MVAVNGWERIRFEGLRTGSNYLDFFSKASRIS